MSGAYVYEVNMFDNNEVDSVNEKFLEECSKISKRYKRNTDETELDKYRKLGSVEELQILSEKSDAKKVKYIGNKNYGRYYCPSCEVFLGHSIMKCPNYCNRCGQKLKL